MLKKLRQALEDPIHPLLGPTLWGLKTWGLWQPNKRLRRILYNCRLICVILFVFTQYMELWLLRFDLEQALRNLSITMLSTISVMKAGTFVLWQKHWKSVINYVSTLERRQISSKDEITENIMRDYTKYSRIVTYLYWCLCAISVSTAVMAPLATVMYSGENMTFIRNGSAPYPEIMSSWTPFDKSKGCGYWVLFVVHSVVFLYGGGIVAIYDSNVVVLMTFFSGQMKLLKANCARVFGEENERLDYKVAKDRIRECHIHHVQLVQNAELLNSMLSPIMFMYVIICSLMICSTAVQLTMGGITGMQQIWIVEYVISLIAQLFVYCWHSHQVLESENIVRKPAYLRAVREAREGMAGCDLIPLLRKRRPKPCSETVMSEQVEDGAYASAWWMQDLRMRRSLALLAGQLRKSVVFTAGPFTDLSVTTFVSIMKASYSYYTLLSSKQK